MWKEKELVGNDEGSFPGSFQLLTCVTSESLGFLSQGFRWVLPLNNVLKTTGIHLSLEASVCWPRKTSQGNSISLLCSYYSIHVLLKLGLASKERIAVCLSNSFMLTRLLRNICANQNASFIFQITMRSIKINIIQYSRLTSLVYSYCAQVNI